MEFQRLPNLLHHDAHGVKIPVMPCNIPKTTGTNISPEFAWIDNVAGVDCCGMGSLLTKGTSEEIAASAARVRRIIDETRAESPLLAR